MPEGSPSLLLCLAPRCEMEELEAGGPALGATGELGQLLWAQRLMVDIVKEVLDFPGAETQRVRAHLEQTRDAQPRDVRERRGAALPRRSRSGL